MQLRTSLIVVMLLVASAIPVSGATGTADVSLSQSGCTFNVTYTWSGLAGGAKLGANVYLVGSTEGFVHNEATSEVAARGGSAGFVAPVTLTGRPDPQGYYGYAFLTKKFGDVIADSTAQSDPTSPVSCP